MERERIREPEAVANSDYDKTIRHYQEWAERQRTGQPMIPHVNHPNFGYAITPEELMQVRGEKFFEVYNGHPRVNNEGDATRLSTDVMWDVMLTKRLTELRLPCVHVCPAGQQPPDGVGIAGARRGVHLAR